MEKEIFPNSEEVNRWLLDTVKHSCSVEYFLEKFGIQNKQNRPHDITEENNKFEWDILRGFALQYRNEKSIFENSIVPALEKHRKQYHHQMWNFPDTEDKTKPCPLATDKDMILGAIDSVCSMRENRHYQGRSYSYDEIFESPESFLPHQVSSVEKIVLEMEKMEQPKLHLIDSLKGFPNIGLKNEVYENILFLLDNSVSFLEKEKGYKFL